MLTMKKWFVLIALCAGLHLPSLAQQPGAIDGPMVVTLLGTGSPEPRLDRFSASTLVQVAGKNLLFDVGRGASMRLTQIGVSLGKIDAVFLTHYHSDHVVGLPDLWLTGWLPPYGARQMPLRVYGPVGVNKLVEGLKLAFNGDVAIRLLDGFSRPGSELAAIGFADSGVVLDADGVRVEAFRVHHGRHVDEAFGFKVSYQGRSLVISGDTDKSDKVVQAAKGSDLLVHEVAIAASSMRDLPITKLILEHHVTPREAGEVFAASKPKLAAYSHLVYIKGSDGIVPTVAQIVAETRMTYSGPLVVGEDLTRFVIGNAIAVQQFNVAAGKFIEMPPPVSAGTPN